MLMHFVLMLLYLKPSRSLYIIDLFHSPKEDTLETSMNKN